MIGRLSGLNSKLGTAPLKAPTAKLDLTEVAKPALGQARPKLGTDSLKSVLDAKDAWADAADQPQGEGDEPDAKIRYETPNDPAETRYTARPVREPGAGDGTV